MGLFISSAWLTRVSSRQGKASVQNKHVKQAAPGYYHCQPQGFNVCSSLQLLVGAEL
jgi:hypothetical protein